MADLVNLLTDTQGWDTVINSNNDEVNGQLSSMLNADNPTGTNNLPDVAALTSAQLVDNSTGTPSTTIPDAGGSYSQATMNDINASLLDQINKLQTEVTNLRTKQNALIAELRQTGGVGILADEP